MTLKPNYLMVKLEAIRTSDAKLGGMDNPLKRGKERFAKVVDCNFTYQELKINRKKYPKKGDYVLLPKMGGITFFMNGEEYQMIHIEDLSLWMTEEEYVSTIASSDRSDHRVNL